MINNWKAILGGSYSMWAFYAIVALEGGLTALASLSPELAPSGQVQAVAILALAFLGGVGRIMNQPNLGDG